MQLKVLGLQGATSIDLVVAATQKMTAEDVKAVLAKTALEKADLKAILRMHGLSEAEAENTAQTILNSRANMTAASSTNAYTTSTNSLKVAFKGLGAAIKSNPIMLIITLLPAVIGLVNKIKNDIEEARNAAIEAGQATADNSKQLSTLIDEYKKLAEHGIEDVESRNSAAKIQQQIVDLVGAQASNLDLVNGKLDNELSKLQQINQEVTDIATLQSAYENAKDKTGSKKKIHVKGWADIDTSSADIRITEGQMPSLQSGQRQTVLKIIQDAVGEYGNAYNLAGSAEIEAYFKNLAEDDYKTRLEIYNEIIENLRKNGFTSDDAVFSQFLKQKNELQSLYDEQSKAANNLLSGLIQNNYFEQETDVSSLEEYISLRDKIINEIKSEGTVQDMIANNSISNDEIEKGVDSYLGGLNQYSDYYNEWYKKFGSDIAKNTEKIRASLLNSDDVNDVNNWIDGLTDKEKEIVFKIETKYGDSNDDWSLEKWQEELTNWQIPETEKFSFSDLIKDDSDNSFKKKVDDYKDKITELDDALADLRNGELSEEDQIKLFENFPELASQADDLDEALVNLIDDFENNAIDDFNEKLEYMDTDESRDALNALKSSILGLSKTKNGVADLKSEISNLKTALDDLSDTYSNMKSIIDDYNENGYLTLDNLQSIMDMQPEYINLLIDENGQINLNNQAYKEYVASKAKSLLVNELQDLYSSILGMKVEEAQAYANAEAYNEETRSVQDLLTATTQLYYAKAMAKDSANNTTAYTDAMSRSFNTAANYASMVNSYINSLSTSQNEFNHVTKEATDSTNEHKDALEAEKDALEAQKDALEDTKDALEDYKDELSDAQSFLKDLIDLVTDYIKQTKEDEKSALEEQIETLDKQKDALDEAKDKYADLIDKKKEAIKAAYDEKEAQDELLDKQKSVAKDRLALEVAGLDDSSAGRKAQKQARDNLAESENSLHEHQDERAYDFQIKELEDLQTQFEEGIEKRKVQIDSQVEHIKTKIDEIDKYFENSRQLYEDACAMIDDDNGTLYSNLWNYTYQYTTQTKAEFDHLWASAQEALAKYRGDNDSLLSVMETLQTEIYNTEGQIADLDLQIDEVGKSIDTMNQQIDNSSGAIDNVSSSIGGLASNLANYKKILDELAEANNDNGIPLNAKWTFEYADRNGQLQTAWSTSSDFETAVRDIQSVIERETGYYRPDVFGGINKHFASGTRHSPAEFISQEKGLEAIFAKKPNSSGSYTLTTPDSQVFDSKRTDNLYNFSGNPEEFISKLAERGLSLLSGDELSALGWGRSIDVSQLFSGLFNSPDFVKNLTGVAGATYNNDNSASNDVYSISMPIQIYGNPDQSVVQAFNRLIPTFKKEMINELVRIGEKYRR